jgi:hypothetical protein
VTERRYPISPGDKVRHIDGRSGVVEWIFPEHELSALPCARVRFKDGVTTLPLGFLQRVGSLEVD